ncbi:MAG: efflux transporter outer membrane subunit [Alistipes sp.]|nr:efflux transporter outer membrane subunit [Alistipes sp.]
MKQSPNNSFLSSVTAFVAIAIFAACNPSLPRPTVTIPTEYLYGENFSQDTLGIWREWWQIFGDSTLNALEEQALANNHNIEIALSRVEQARLQLSTTRATFLPSFAVGLSVDGKYDNVDKYTINYDIGPSLTWEFGMAGRLKHSLGAARAAILENEWASRGTILAVTAEVATTYFTLLQYERNLDIARRTYALRAESVALIDSMFRYGISSGVDLEQARSLMFTAAADISQYERALAQTRLTLNTLLGEPPAETDETGIGLNLLSDFIPIEIPIGLPSDLLHRRPDVMEAFQAMVGSGEKVGIARAERFPSVAMTISGGIASDRLKGLVTGMPFVWGATRSLTQPVFAFGKLKRNEEIARQAYLQSVATYQQTVLEALADVEKALVGIETGNIQTERSADLVLANGRVARMARALYDGGLADHFNLIDAERALYESQLQLINLVAQQYINYVTLFKALGGGWEIIDN